MKSIANGMDIIAEDNNGEINAESISPTILNRKTNSLLK